MGVMLTCGIKWPFIPAVLPAASLWHQKGEFVQVSGLSEWGVDSNTREMAF